MSGQWYVMGRDEIHGPYSKEHVQRLVEAGRIKPITQVRQGNVGSWRLASKVPGLFGPESNPQKPTATGMPRPLVLGLVIGGAVLGTSVLTAALCISLLGRSQPAPLPPAARMPVLAAADEEPRPTEDEIIRPPEIALTPPDDEPSPASPEVVATPPIAPESVAPVADKNAVAEQPVPADPPAIPSPATTLDPKPIIPPVPVEKTAIDDAKIDEFNKSVRLELKGKDAYARYLVFSQSFAFTDEQRGRVDVELAEWKERADKDLHRLGTEWVALEKVHAAEKEADKLIERAFALIKTGSYKECVNFLEDASRVNPNGIRANYTLGLLNSLPFGFKAPAIAEKHFRTVLLRSPNNAAALNSLAISQLKQREFGVAMTSFARSAELTPKCQEVAHNLGRAVMLAEQGRLPIEPGQLRRFTDLYSQLIADERAKPYEEHTGWLHMLPVFSPKERKQAESDIKQKNPELVPAFGGSGFVVAPELIITNRHVVHDEDGRGTVDAVGIVDPSDKSGKRELVGTVTAISDETDLAIVRFPGLALPALRLNSVDAKRAEEVMILGYPRTSVFGSGLKSTRGVVADVPDASRPMFPDYYMFDAISDHGNSGGPIIDSCSRVVAVLTAGIGLQARVVMELEAEFSAGVPASKVAQFAASHIEKFDEVNDAGVNDDVKGEWADNVERVAPSVLRLTCYYKAGLGGLNVADNRQKNTSGAWEDYTCPFCSGNSRVACPGKGCISGRVSVPYYVDEVVGAGMNRQTIRHKKVRKERCGTCDGAGTLDCRGCIGGIDRFLLP